MTAAAPSTSRSDTTTTPIVRAHALEKRYGTSDNPFTALHALSLTIPRGRMVALLGPSGSGKSTLLNLLGAVDRPTTGSIQIAGHDLSHLSDADLALFRRRRLGFVFQSFHLLPSLTVFDNVAVPFTLDRKLTPDRRRDITQLLARLGVAEKSARYPDELSGGQQQRVALARAVIHRPDLVLADEPTGNLDAATGRVILDLLADLQRQSNTSVILATHSEEAAQRCHDQIRLADGRVTAVQGAVEISD